MTYGYRVGRETVLKVPYYLLSLAAALPWLWLWVRHLRRRRRRLAEGHCSSCAYDLTGNISGVCSECGTPIDVDVAPRRG